MADNPRADELLYDPVQIHANKSSWRDSWNPGELVRRRKVLVLFQYVYLVSNRLTVSLFIGKRIF